MTDNPFHVLSKYKRAYVVYSIGQKFIDMTETLIGQLNRYSKYPVFLYYSRGTVNFNSPNLIKQKFEFPDLMDYNLHGLDPEKVRERILNNIKPLVVDKFLNDYNIDEFVYLDADILVTPIIDSVFTKYADLIENSPIFLKYTWDWVFVNGKPQVGDKILEKLDIERNPTVYSLCAGFFIGNKNCKSFMSDYKRICLDPDLIKMCIDDPLVYEEFNDEPIANAVVWLYEGKHYVQPDLLWTWNFESVKFMFDFYDGKVGSLPEHPSLPNHYQIPQEYEIPHGLSVIPKLKMNLLGIHSLKDPEMIRKAAEEIEKRF